MGCILDFTAQMGAPKLLLHDFDWYPLAGITSLYFCYAASINSLKK